MLAIQSVIPSHLGAAVMHPSSATSPLKKSREQIYLGWLANHAGQQQKPHILN